MHAANHTRFIPRPRGETARSREIDSEGPSIEFGVIHVFHCLFRVILFLKLNKPKTSVQSCEDACPHTTQRRKAAEATLRSQVGASLQRAVSYVVMAGAKQQKRSSPMRPCEEELTLSGRSSSQTSNGVHGRKKDTLLLRSGSELSYGPALCGQDITKQLALNTNGALREIQTAFSDTSPAGQMAPGTFSSSKTCGFLVNTAVGRRDSYGATDNAHKKQYSHYLKGKHTDATSNDQKECADCCIITSSRRG